MSELNASVDDFFLLLLLLHSLTLRVYSYEWLNGINVFMCVREWKMCKYHYFGTHSVHNKLHFLNWMWRKQKEIIPKCDFRIDSTFVSFPIWMNFEIHQLVAHSDGGWHSISHYPSLRRPPLSCLLWLHTRSLALSFSPLDFSYLFVWIESVWPKQSSGV